MMFIMLQMPKAECLRAVRHTVCVLHAQFAKDYMYCLTTHVTCLMLAMQTAVALAPRAALRVLQKEVMVLACVLLWQQAWPALLLVSTLSVPCWYMCR